MRQGLNNQDTTIKSSQSTTQLKKVSVLDTFKRLMALTISLLTIIRFSYPPCQVQKLSIVRGVIGSIKKELHPLVTDSSQGWKTLRKILHKQSRRYFRHAAFWRENWGQCDIKTLGSDLKGDIFLLYQGTIGDCSLLVINVNSEEFFLTSIHKHLLQWHIHR